MKSSSYTSRGFIANIATVMSGLFVYRGTLKLRKKRLN